MSARQVSRINQEIHLKELEKANNELTSSDNDDKPVKRSTAYMFADSSESESEHNDLASSDNEPIQYVKAAKLTESKDSHQKETIDDMAYLDSLTPNAEPVSANHSTVPSKPFFVIDSKALDVDKVLNDKFSQINFMKQFEEKKQPAGGRKKQPVAKGVMRKNLVANYRSYIFGSPKEDWTKPPSFIGGGSQMVRTVDAHNPTVSHFDLQWSVEYNRTNELYILIQNTGDVNRLIMFLANHPYHIEGMLQLSMVFARFGMIERSTDLVRRCLYCFECSFIESFKPFSGLCRMSPSSKENSLFYQTLFKHMQHCFTLGCNSLAADICRLILSLNPADRSHSVLLTLDYYLLQAAQYDVLLSFTDEATETPKEIESLDFSTYEMSHPYPITNAAIATDRSVMTISDLPNWWYSLALSLYLGELDQQRKQSYNNTTSDNAKPASIFKTSASNKHAVSSFFLKCALWRYPFVLEPLMGKAGVTIGMFANSTWKSIFHSEYFLNSIERTPSKSYLRSVCSIYASRAGTLWNTPEIHAWVIQAATAVSQSKQESSALKDVIALQTTHFAEVSKEKYLSHYSNAKLEDYIEEVTRMPNDINNLIDPQLLDPRILAGQVHFDAQQLGVQLPRNRPRMNRHERELLEQRQREEQSNMLDLTMPLLELFFASMIPWFRLPNPRNNRR